MNDDKNREELRWFYDSKQWRKVRELYKKQQLGLCERCYKRGNEVHHKIYLTPENVHDPKIALDFSNLELLCTKCHNEEHKRSGKVTRDGLEFDSDGFVIKKTPPVKWSEKGCWNQRAWTEKIYIPKK